MAHLHDDLIWQQLSLAGMALVEVSYMPQIARLFRMKEAHEFHLLYPSLNLVGRIVALIGAVALNRPDMMWSFIIGISVRATLLSQVLYYRRREARLATLDSELIAV